MDDFTDTHLCLVCQTTLIGLDNYIIHKRNACPAGKPGSQSSKVDPTHGLPGPSAGDTTMLSGHQYQHQDVRQTDTERHQYGHNLQAQSASSHSLTPVSGYIALPSCQQNRSVLGQNTVLSSTSHQGSTSYLHSHLSLDSTSHSLSSLIGDHSATGPFHSSSHQLDDLSQLQPAGHNLPPDLTSDSSQKLPSIRTFRSSTRLLPNITREPAPQLDSAAHAFHLSMPFSHNFHVNREHMGAGDHLGHSHSLTSTTSSLGLNASTSQFSSTALTAPYTTTTLSSMTLASTSSHDILTHSTSHTADLHVEVSDAAVVSFVNTLSPTTSRVVDPNMVLYDSLPDKDTTFTDFFSSLELQYRVETDVTRPMSDGLHKTSPSNDTDHLKVGNDGRLDIDHNKALHIANIINELAFSSDSDNILPSDTENLFDTSDEDSDDGTGLNPPSSHTGGKWFPGQKPATPKHDSSVIIPDKWNSSGKGIVTNKSVFSPGKSSPIASKVTSAKIRTGLGKGKSMSGKWRAVEAQQRHDEYDSEEEDKGEVSDDEQEPDEEEHHVGRGKFVSSGKVFPSGKLMAADKTYHCKPCKRTLLNKVSYERHCSTTGHIKRAKNQDENTQKGSDENDSRNKKVEEENIDCTVCNKTFNNRYNFARHLVSGYHQRKVLTDHKVMLLEEPYQLLLSRQSRFQCHICQFYCNTTEQLNVHVFSPGHSESVSSLLGPLLCVRCKFASRSNAEMLDHIEGEQHQKTIDDSDRPCVLRESRYRVQCRSCENIFHSATSLKKHIENTHCDQVESGKHVRKKTHRREGPPVCPYCQTKWPSYVHMEIHIRRKHTFEKPFRCEDCNKGFADKCGLKIHCQSKRHLARLVELGDIRPLDAIVKPTKKTNRKVTHKCKLCDYVAEKYTDLRPHFLQNHMEAVLECTTCGVKFVSQSAYNIHMNSKLHLRTEEEALHSTATFTCDICGKKFYNSKKYVLHKIVHRNLQTRDESMRKVCMSETGISSKYQEFLDSIKSVKPGQKVTCPLCSRSITKQQIFTHLRIHENVSPFGCIYCAQSFACPKSLQRHLAGHLGIKSLVCGICQKKFSRERGLAVHMKTEHSGKKKKFQCSLCKLSFSHKWELRVHLLNHLKPVHCKHAGCLMRFKTESTMLTHYRTHSGEKPFLCDQCAYAASTQQHLNRHRRTHTGERQYQCEYCEYRAINSTNLSRHMRIHIGTKPFKCPYCPLTCNTLENIRKHVMKTKKHAGKPVYCCKACDTYGTNSAAEFKIHLTKVHSVTEQNINILSEYAGLYNKTADVKTLPEGARVIPIKDRHSKSQGSKKRKASNKAAINDHEYSLNTPAKQARKKVAGKQERANLTVDGTG